MGIFELRVHLEGLAAGMAADRASPAQLDSFERVDAEMRELAQSMASDDPSTVRVAMATNRRFHLSVAALAGNNRLYETIRRLLDEGERIQSLDPNFRQVGFLIGAHVDVFNALRRGEATLASDTMQDHIRQTHLRVLGSIRTVYPTRTP